MPLEDKVLAVVEGKEITQKQLNLLIEQAPADQQAQFRTREGQRQLLNEMIAQELFYLKGKDEHVEDTEQYQKEFSEMKEKFLKSYMISHFMSDIKVSEEELKAYYQEHSNQFIAPDSIRASHILLPSKQQAIDIINEINKGDKSFEQAAKDYSLDQSNRNKGGDLGYFHKGQMVAEFEVAAFALEPGEMTKEPVKSQFGYHIIKVTDKKIKEKIPFEAAHDSLHRFLLGQKQNRAYVNEAEDLKEKYSVEIKLGI
ncbi:peptidylprolyl isomerase [Pseudoramibacter sp.]|jgi:peptidyl-prolyl cis-trans isomerase C|uniref:peptidylprolyl isomerase n=1 Tax=Pseudoramibacter sp. TaxID=2034862 RepID=UPI0025E3AA15|nr:peptidylprolyl isomerase [Pseudoramibacter sp.]MCH4072815.1 peptidylprolyl isomerase [Pseudoramibacter sp.]MCH4106586.1 peptidylprolyl isomerase [Pseudoramibacter sp.]